MGTPHGDQNEQILDRISRLELELKDLRVRRVDPVDWWPVLSYVIFMMAASLSFGFWAARDVSFIPELVNDAAPTMLIAGGLFYAFTAIEFAGTNPASAPGTSAVWVIVGNRYLASIAFLMLAGACGWLFVDKSHTSMQFALIADINMVLVLGAHGVGRLATRPR